MDIYVLYTYDYDTFSYSGLSECLDTLFKNKQNAIDYGEKVLGLRYLENVDLAFDQQSDKHFTVEKHSTKD
jgi:hypothetical protein